MDMLYKYRRNGWIETYWWFPVQAAECQIGRILSCSL